MDKKRFAELGPNDIILTPNQRLANTLQKEIQNYHFSAGHLAYAPPTLLSFSQFVQTMKRNGYGRTLLINRKLLQHYLTRARHHI
jgi:hypothetical protein